MTRNKISAMKFARVYPLYVQKAQRKDRTREEVDQVSRSTGRSISKRSSPRHRAFTRTAR